MQFAIDEKRKQRLASQVFWKSTGAKVALAGCILAAIAFISAMTANFLEAWKQDYSSQHSDYTTPIMGLSLLLGLASIGVLISIYRRRNWCLAARKKEHLTIENGWLRYSFAHSRDKNTHGLTEFAIDLRQTTLTRGASGECRFAQGLRGCYYQDSESEVMYAIEEMEPVTTEQTFAIWDYWQPNLYDTLVKEQERLARTPATTEAGQQEKTATTEATQATSVTASASTTLRVNTTLQVERQPQKGVAVFFYILAGYMAWVTISNFLTYGNVSVFILLTIVLWAWRRARRATATTEDRRTTATFTLDKENLVIDLPGGGFYNGKSVDQRWTCGRKQIRRVQFLKVDHLHIFSNQATSQVSRNGQVLATENQESVSIELRLDVNGRKRVHEFLTGAGFKVE